MPQLSDAKTDNKLKVLEDLGTDLPVEEEYGLEDPERGENGEATAVIIPPREVKFCVVLATKQVMIHLGQAPWN
jgi:hypothetical protein